MKHAIAHHVAVLALVVMPLAAGAAAKPKAAATPKKIYVAIFDFASTPARRGQQLADSLRIMLRRHKEYEVIDRLTTREAAEKMPVTTDRKKVVALMTDELAVHVAIYGTIEARGGGMTARVRCIDLSDAKSPGGWTREFSDDTERARGILSTKIVETLRKEAQWVPPEYGDEDEPKKFGQPVNLNGRFEDGHKGWEHPDNVATFLEPGPAGRGKVLRIRTDLKRAPWMAYRRKLRFGQADPTRPPAIGPDSSYASVAGMEGVFYRGDWLDATTGQRYWLVADMKGKTAGIFFPKIFVKGYLDYTAHATALPETSLVERKMTPGQFADLPEAKQKALVADDVKRHPDRYRRECFRWYLACRNEENVWKHYAAPFPPRGGLPKNVRWMKIEVYAYWPPGNFTFDDVLMYKDPRQKAPLDEAKPRSKFLKHGGIQPQPK